MKGGRPQYPPSREDWTCKDGTRVRIEDMATSHILNSIAKIKHSPKLWRAVYLPLLEAELAKRGIGHEQAY